MSFNLVDAGRHDWRFYNPTVPTAFTPDDDRSDPLMHPDLLAMPERERGDLPLAEMRRGLPGKTRWEFGR